jgi:hypothetical protein
MWFNAGQVNVLSHFGSGTETIAISKDGLTLKIKHSEQIIERADKHGPHKVIADGHDIEARFYAKLSSIETVGLALQDEDVIEYLYLSGAAPTIITIGANIVPMESRLFYVSAQVKAANRLLGENVLTDTTITATKLRAKVDIEAGIRNDEGYYWPISLLSTSETELTIYGS